MTILQLRLLSRAIVQKEVKVPVQMKVTSKILLQKRQKTQSPNSVDFDSPATSFFQIESGPGPSCTPPTKLSLSTFCPAAETNEYGYVSLLSGGCRLIYKIPCIDHNGARGKLSESLMSFLQNLR